MLKIIGLLELFGCQFMKSICGEHLKVRLPTSVYDANPDTSQLKKAAKTDGKTTNKSKS